MSKRAGWGREFDDPIELPDGGELVTLKDAGNYITKLPKAEHEAPEWQAAMEALILVAERGGPTMLPPHRHDARPERRRGRPSPRYRRCRGRRRARNIGSSNEPR